MKRISLLLFLMVTLTLLAVSCGGNRPSDGRIVIAALRGPSSVAMVQMIDSIRSAADATVEIQIYDEPMQVRKMMLEGTADFALLPTTMAALLYNRGLDYRLAAVPLWGTLYLCGTSDVQDLKGERVYLMAKGMTPDVMFRYLLTLQGLRPEMDVALDYRYPTHIDLANAAIAGRAPLCVLSEPYLSLALKKNPQLRIISDLSEQWREAEGELPETAFVVRGAFAEGSQADVEALVEAYARSGEWVKSNPEAAARLAVEYRILPDCDAALASIPRTHIAVIPAAAAANAVENYLKTFYFMDSKIIGDRLPDEKFYNR